MNWIARIVTVFQAPQLIIKRMRDQAEAVHQTSLTNLRHLAVRRRVAALMDHHRVAVLMDHRRAAVLEAGVVLTTAADLMVLRQDLAEIGLIAAVCGVVLTAEVLEEAVILMTEDSVAEVAVEGEVEEDLEVITYYIN